jgi:hypothetical protein
MTTKKAEEGDARHEVVVLCCFSKIIPLMIIAACLALALGLRFGLRLVRLRHQ